MVSIFMTQTNVHFFPPDITLKRKLYMVFKSSVQVKCGFGKEKSQTPSTHLDNNTNSMDMSLSKLQEDSKGQGSLACCSAWSHKELDMTKQLTITLSLTSRPQDIMKFQ